jgi:hypothetical protein
MDILDVVIDLDHLALNLGVLKGEATQTNLDRSPSSPQKSGNGGGGRLPTAAGQTR